MAYRLRALRRYRPQDPATELYLHLVQDDGTVLPAAAIGEENTTVSAQLDTVNKTVLYEINPGKDEKAEYFVSLEQDGELVESRPPKGKSALKIISARNG